MAKIKLSKKNVAIATAIIAPFGFLYLGYLLAKYIEKKVNTKEEKQYNK